MTRTTPEVAPSLQTSSPHQPEDVCSPTYDLTFNRSSTGWTFNGIGIRNLRPQSRNLTTRPQRPRGHYPSKRLNYLHRNFLYVSCLIAALLKKKDIALF
ncbi:hypothetical protein AVEN_83870-1 [Araneus ventricosus]|uniref:Uncharacterized protein n=1 Tax=Araneus ventricosus TaxID=182803 RepID=A0A4Y2FF09_ARAVE|nr:hypothetical protein AVEN_83870-1 [Araneus ventricosus]